jgi:hypothetical protein
MRKYLLVICCCTCVTLPAQVFQSKDLIFSLGFGSYRGNFTETDTAGYSGGWVLFGNQFPVRIEYGIAERLSANFSYTYTSWGEHYFSRFEKHNLIEVGPGLSYHLPWEAKRIDFVGELECGYTRYKFMNYDTSNYSANARGTFVRGGLSPRIYFTKTYRLGAVVYYRFSYSAMSGRKEDHLNPDWEYNLDGLSHSYGIGLFYRFGSLRPSAYIDNTKPE